MSIWGKTVKTLSIVAITLGSVVTAAGVIMVGISSYKTESLSIRISPELWASVNFGIGFNNYGQLNLWVSGNNPIHLAVSSASSYKDFIDKLKANQLKMEVHIFDKTVDISAKVSSSVVDSAVLTYNLMLCGAIVSPIGLTILVLGLVFLIINKKKLKVPRNSKDINTNETEDELIEKIATLSTSL